MSADDAELVNYLVRMVIPIRREFGRKLDVGQFRLDESYASEVLELARKSLDPRLREYGLHVEQRLLGARGAGPAAASSARLIPPPPAADSTERTGATPPVTAASAYSAVAVDRDAEDALRAKVMKKYTSGLR